MQVAGLCDGKGSMSNGPLDPMDPLDMHMSNGHLSCPLDPMDIDMSSGHLILSIGSNGQAHVHWTFGSAVNKLTRMTS